MLQIVNWYRIFSHQHHLGEYQSCKSISCLFSALTFSTFSPVLPCFKSVDSPARDGDAFRTLRTSSSRTLNLLVSFRLDGGGKTMAMHQNVFYQNPGSKGKNQIMKRMPIDSDLRGDPVTPKCLGKGRKIQGKDL